jgi:hypothetical protein
VNGPPAELRVRLIQAAYESAIAEGRYEAPQTRRAPSRARLYRDGRLTLLAPFFDYGFYAYENPDFADSGLDELEHYNFFGWPKLRNPTAWFDTGYYLSANPDVLASGDNPFWHYIFKGRAEGRAPRRPRAAERAILDALTPPQTRAAAAPADLPRLSAEALASRLAQAVSDAPGFVYSLGDDERGGPAPPGYVGLHATPLRGGEIFKIMPAPWSETRLALNGEPLGVATDADIARALGGLRETMPARRALAVRGLAGASVDGLLAIEAALEPDERLFYLNDYSSLCASRRLLRNDVAFCAAPPPDSQACAICVHGEARLAQLQAVERLFQRCRFKVIAPSQSALALWRRASDWPHESAAVAEPARMEARAEPTGPVEIGALGTEGRPVRVAFIGPRALERGWLTFERMLETCGELTAYALHHFAGQDDLRPSRNLVNVAVPADATPAALRDLMIARRIDLVVAAAEWAEPFSYAAVAALAAGCDLVALRHSGLAAELIETDRRGRLFEDSDEAVEFFVSGKAVAYARERDRFPRFVAELSLDGAAFAALPAERRA